MIKNKGGRPKKIINKQIFESACGLFMSREDICTLLDVSDKTLDKYCHDEYGESFSAFFAQKRKTGELSLRASTFAMAKKSAAMGIFWLKNYAGMKDTIEITPKEDRTEDPLSLALRKAVEVEPVDKPEAMGDS